MPLGSDVAQPYVGELGDQRPGITADVVRVDEIGNKVEKDDGREAYYDPGSEVGGEERIEEGHCWVGEGDGGRQDRRLRI